MSNEPTPPAPQTELVDLWNRADERSVINLVPQAVSMAMVDAGKKDPALFQMDEHTLWMTLKYRKKLPNATDNRLRLAFWLEYDRAQQDHKHMEMSAVYSGVCSRSLFYAQYLDDPERVAWLLCPPVDYTMKIQEALDFGTDRMREILAMDPHDAKGRPNVKLMELQAKIWALMDQRIKGAYTQRIEQRSLSLTVKTTDKQVAQAAMENSMDALDRRIKELDRRERAALNLPQGEHEPRPAGTVTVLPPDNS